VQTEENYRDIAKRLVEALGLIDGDSSIICAAK
jgi:hypothetical protein